MGIDYIRQGDTIEIIVKDTTGAKIDHKKCLINDKKRYSAILRYMRDKYGAEIEVEEFPPKAGEMVKAGEVDWWGKEV